MMTAPIATALASQSLDPALQLMLLMASLSFIPFIIMGMTSFLRYIIVLSLVKNALGTQQVPPAMVLVGLAFILTLHTMSPVINETITITQPMMQKGSNIVQVLDKGSIPLKRFMLRQTSQQDLAFFLDLAGSERPKRPEDVSIFQAAPAFMLSELKTSFEIGFIIFIPFVVLDIVVANILTALGMMMMSPTVISLPFKILIFVAVDGWGLIVNGLVQSFH
jgi:flagellar biosynthetic protein FliP